MPKTSGLQFLLRLHQRGGFTDHEAAHWIINLAGTTDVGELVSNLPSELLTEVQRAVAKAPTTEEDWGRIIIICGDTFTCGQDYDPEAEQARMRSGYRAGVEVLRHHFGREEADVKPG